MRFFAIKNMQNLINDAGLKIVAARLVVKDPSKTELADKWRRLPLMQKFALRRNKYGNIYQVVVKAAKIGTPMEGLDLDAIAVPPCKIGARLRLFKSRRKRKSKRRSQ